MENKLEVERSLDLFVHSEKNGQSMLDAYRLEQIKAALLPYGASSKTRASNQATTTTIELRKLQSTY